MSIEHSPARATHSPVLDRFIREAECEHITGLSRTTRWRLERKGQFPKRRAISENTRGWLASEIERWVAERAEASAA